MKHKRLIPTLAVAAAAATLTVGATRPQDDPVLDVPGTREAMKAWVENNRMISKARSDWQVEQQVLKDRIVLMTDEIARTRAATEEASQSIGSLDEELAGLLEDDESLKAAVGALEEAVADAERRIKALVPSLPEPLLAQIESLTKRLPDDPADAKVNLPARFIAVAGILQLIDRFDQQVTTDSTIVTLPSGQNASVATIFLGLGQAYYVTSDGQNAGVGRPTPEGWVWTAANDAGPQILEAIRIADGDSAPGYVQLPVKVD
ncbi:MAG: DUF3450 family protein [Planctomycetota bacterium]